MKNMCIRVAIYVIVASGTASNNLCSQSWSERPLQKNPAPAPPKHTPYFQMTDEQQAALARKVQQINLGDSRESLIALLGRPDSDDGIVRKEDPKRLVVRIVRYYVVRYEKNSVNDFEDRCVSFIFNPADHLTQIQSNVRGIPGRPLKLVQRR